MPHFPKAFQMLPATTQGLRKSPSNSLQNASACNSPHHRAVRINRQSQPEAAAKATRVPLTLTMAPAPLCSSAPHYFHDDPQPVGRQQGRVPFCSPPPRHSSPVQAAPHQHPPCRAMSAAAGGVGARISVACTLPAAPHASTQGGLNNAPPLPTCGSLWPVQGLSLFSKRSPVG